MKIVRAWTLLPLLGMLAGANGALAAVIPVSNASFEILPAGGLPFGCGAGCSYSGNDPIPGWVSTGVFGQFQPGVQASNFTYFNSVPDGITVAYSNGGTISQIVSAVAVAGTTYTLNVDVGFRKDLPDPGSVSLLVGSNTILATGVADPLSGNFVNYTASYTATASDAGGAISILLSSPGAQGDWDNVSLSDSTAIPEPGSLALFGAGLVAVGLLRRKARAG